MFDDFVWWMTISINKMDVFFGFEFEFEFEFKSEFESEFESELVGNWISEKKMINS